MLTKIIKRDGREVAFDRVKIADAIYKAAQVLGGNDYEMAQDLAEKVETYVENTIQGRIPTVEEVQDAVEHTLIENGHARTAKEYILYRAERTRVREMNTRLMKTLEDLTFKDAEDNDVKRENANIDGDTAMGTMLKYGSESAKQFYEMYVLNPKHAKAHREGDIHIHDLDFLTLTTTCCQIDIIKLFKDGFSTGHGFLREPNDIQSYSALACIAIQSNQNDQHGGQSIPNFDYGMAIGVAKTYSKLYTKNLAKAAEILEDKPDLEEKFKEIKQKIADETGVKPRLEASEEYCRLEAPYLAEIVGKVHYFPMGKEEPQLSDAVEVVHERPKAITGTQTVSALETDAGSHPVDGVFILRDAIAPSQLVPGLATEENHVKVNLQMETNLPGLFACGDITGKPYQYIKAAGQGNVAALSAVEYLDKKKREI